MNSLFNKYKTFIIQFIKYFFVGAAATVFDYGIFFISYNIFTTSYLWATTFGIIIGIIVNYFFSLRYVFNADSSLIDFICICIFALIGVGITYLLMWLGVDQMGLNVNLVRLFSYGIVFIWNFMSRRVYYSNKTD